MRTTRRKRRALAVFGAVISLIVLYTGLYYWGMAALEGRPRTLLQSFGVVIEAMTTTGYGGDAPWEHPLMIILSSIMQASGIVGVFALLNVLAENRLRRVLNGPPESEVDSSLQDHVVICGVNENAEFISEELDSADKESVLVDSDPERVRELRRDGCRAIYGNPQTEKALRDARAHTASHIVIDIDKKKNTSAILAAERETEDANLIVIANEERLRPYYHYAGADTVLSPRELTGKALADKASTGVKSDIDNGAKLGDELEMREVTVPTTSPLIGKRIRDTSLEEQTGVTIVGAWIDGILQLPPNPDSTLTENSVLVIAGKEDEIEELQEYVSPPQIPATYDNVIIGGYGETGAVAKEYLEKNGVDVTTIDTDAETNPDVVGDVNDRSTLKEAGIEDAGGYIVAVTDDAAALLSILVCRQVCGENLEIEVATISSTAVRKALQAGASYAVSRSRVAGRLIIREIQGQSSLDPTSHIRIAHVEAQGLAGKTLRSAQVRQRVGVTVVAIKRGGDFISPVDPTRELQSDDTFVVVGTDAEVRDFGDTFGDSS